MSIGKPVKGICIDCKEESDIKGFEAEERWLAKKYPPLCKFHNQKRKDSKKKPSVKKAKKQEFHLKESDVFKEIWDESNKTSFVTGKPLPDTQNARAWYFSHVLAKGKAKYPMFKYYKKNIVLKTFQEHETWEYKKSSVINDEVWDKVFKLEAELKAEYVQHETDYRNGRADYYKY